MGFCAENYVVDESRTTEITFSDHFAPKASLNSLTFNASTEFLT